MTKELREVLNEISQKKESAKQLINSNKLDEAKGIKAELEALREKEIELRVAEASGASTMQSKIDSGIGIELAAQGDKVKRKVVDMVDKVFLNVVNPNEKMTDKVKNSSNDKQNVDLGKLVKGMITGKWSDEEREYYNTMQTGGNKVIIPTHLSANIIDLARAKSAIMGSIPVVPMENGNLTIAKLTKDVTGAFVAEGETIPTSGAEFKGIKLETKTLAVLIPLSEKILQDAPNISEILVNSIGKAIAQSADKAFLYGAGDGTEGAKDVKGITTYTEINKVILQSKEKFEYDDVTSSIKPIKKANHTPRRVVMNTDDLLELESSKDTTGQYIIPPKTLENVLIEESNNLNDGALVAFSEDSMIMGIQGEIRIEAGYTQGQFEKMERAIRAYVRLDLAVVQEKGITYTVRTVA